MFDRKTVRDFWEYVGEYTSHFLIKLLFLYLN